MVRFGGCNTDGVAAFPHLSLKEVMFVLVGSGRNATENFLKNPSGSSHLARSFGRLSRMNTIGGFISTLEITHWVLFYCFM